MKKIFILMLISILFLTGCNVNSTTDQYSDLYIENFSTSEVEAAADELYNNSHVPFKIFDLVTDCDPSKIGEDKPYCFGTESNSCYGYGFHYPKDSDDIRITQIHVNEASMDILGIKGGTDISKCKKVFSEYGYTNIESNDDYIIFTKSGIWVKITLYKGKTSNAFIGLNTAPKVDNGDRY